MRMKSVRNSRSQIARVRGGAQTGHIKMGLLQVASHLPKQLLNELLTLWMMNELRFQLRKDCSETFDGQMMLGVPGVERRKGLCRHLLRKSTKLHRTGLRTVHE